MADDHDTTRTADFGYQDVPWEEKARRVTGVFDSVATRYDLMNDLMSLGVHRLWKRYTLALAAVRAGEHVLDLAGGTGDFGAALSEQVGGRGHVVLADFNARMLEQGRQRLTDDGMVGNIDYVQADAQRLPFGTGRFHCLTMAFGLRNVTDKDQALREMFRVLRPGGRALILEFSHVTVPGLAQVYDLYSFNVLPLMGQMVAGDADSYRYLAESIRRHPDQETLKAMMEAAGFERTSYHNLNAGIVAVHRGYKL